MRGVLLFLTIGAALACANARAGQTDAVTALAREKAAAVALMKARAANGVATLAQDRVFGAYLTAATLGEGARMRTRIEAILSTLKGRFGIDGLVLADRSGEVLVRIGSAGPSAEKLDAKSDAMLLSGFAQPARQVALLPQAAGITYATPVVWRDQAEFVLGATQAFASYRGVLARGTGKERFVVLADAKGAVLADTRSGTNTKVVGSYTLDALKRAVKGTARAGAGELADGSDHFNVSYVAVGEWTVIAAETAEPPRRCSKDGTRLCG